MKRFVAILSVIILGLALFVPVEARGKKDGEGKIKFIEMTHDFGTVKEKKGPVTAKFEFVNEGLGNLVIKNVTAQCGCTRPVYPKKPIAPGKKGVIEVTFNPLGRPGSFRKTVTVYSTGKPGKTTLRISGTVVPGK